MSDAATTTVTEPASPGGRRDRAREAVERSWRVLTALDRFVLVLVGLGTVALAPGFVHVNNPRQALVLAAVPLGLALLVQRAARRDAATWVALATVVLALVNGLTSDYRQMSVFGSLAGEASVVALVCAFSCWALGRALSDHARRLLPVVVTAGVAVNIALGLLQIVVKPPLGIYATFDGRASGLMSNPVFFASVLAGMWGYWYVRSLGGAERSHLVVVAVLMFGLGTTGSRGAFLGALAVMALLVLRDRRVDVRAAGATVLGFVAGYVVLSVFSSVNSDRVEQVGSGFGIRFALWRTTLDVIADRPLFGWGFDPYLNPVNEQLTADYVRQYEYLYWTDPHNVVLLVVLAFGIVGLALLSTFGILALRGDRDRALVVASLAIVLSWMLQPITINSWPLAFLLLGAAVRRNGADTPRVGRLAAPLMATGALVGVALAAWSLFFVASARGDHPDTLDDRAGFLRADPAVSARVVLEHKNTGADGDELVRHLDRAEELARAAVDRGGPPNNWVLLVEVQLLQEDYDGALATAREWVDRRPNDPFGLRMLGLAAQLAGDQQTNDEVFERLCDLREPPCVEPGSKGQ